MDGPSSAGASSLGHSEPVGAPPERLTIEGVDPVLRSALEMDAARCGLTVNAFILQVLRESLGLAGPSGLNHDLDALAGIWSLEGTEELTTTIMYLEDFEERFGAPAGEQPAS